MTIEEEIKLLADHVYDWCQRIQEDASWDNWDDWYKDASYPGRKINAIIEKHRTPLGEGKRQ